MIVSVADIAEQLGVSLNEEFEVDSLDYKDNNYRFSENGIEYHRVLTDEWIPSEILGKLLSGEIKIIKKPFKPKKGDTFYYPSDYGVNVSKTVWYDTMNDLAWFKAGWVFRTRKECAEALPKVRDEIKGYNND